MPWDFTIATAWLEEAAQNLPETQHLEWSALRLGQNAVFRSNDMSLIARVYRPDTDRDSVTRSVEVSEKIANSGAQVQRPAFGPTRSIVESSDYIVSYWSYLQEIDRQKFDWKEFGQCLQRFHQEAESIKLKSEWNPLAKTVRRIKSFHESGAPKEHLRIFDEVLQFSQKCVAEFQSSFPIQTIHNDAHKGNSVSTAEGLFLIDFDDIGMGPVEWDLVATAVTKKRLGLADEGYKEFCKGYGYDFFHSKNSAGLSMARELLMVAWLYQNKDQSERIHKEVCMRLESLINEEEKKWTAF